MRCNGYSNATKRVWLYEGKILDGRNTYRACTELGIAPEIVEYSGQYGDPWSFVKMMNLHRLHLTPGQWAMLAAEEHGKTLSDPGCNFAPAPASQVAEEFGVSESNL